MTIMSLQSNNCNQNIVMIPANDDNIDLKPSSSSTFINDSNKSSKLLELTPAENEMETKSTRDDTKVIKIPENSVTMKVRKKSNNRSINCSKIRLRTSKRNWTFSYRQTLFDHYRIQNGYKRFCEKNLRMHRKRLRKLTGKLPTKAASSKRQEQNNDDKLLKLSAPVTDCIVCKEKFVDRPGLYNHIKIAHSDVSIRFCDLCNKIFFNDSELQIHISTIHEETTEIDEEQSILCDDLGKTEVSSKKDTSTSITEINQSIEKPVRQMFISIDGEKISREALEFIEGVTNESIENFEQDDDMFSYTPLNSKKEYNPNHYENCPEMNEMSVVESEWTSPKSNSFNENTQDSIMINNQIRVENCLMPSMEELEDIEELETSYEMNDATPMQHNNQIQNSDYSIVKYKPQLIYDISNTSENQSVELTMSEEHDKLRTQEVNKNVSNDSNETLAISVSSSSIHRTYAPKVTSQVLKKSSSKKNALEKSNFCIMCQEIFSLIEQKNIDSNSDTESMLKCPLCTRQFSSRSSLEQHVAFYHLNCECSKVRTCSPPVPLEVTVAPKLYECVLCPAVFDDYNELNNHILSLHEPVQPFKDRLTIGKPEYLRTVRCSYMESKLSSIKNRNNSGHILKINCPNCELKFFSCNEYSSHVREIHNNTISLESICQDIKASEEVANQDSTTSVKIESDETTLNKSIGTSVNSELRKNATELRKTCKRCNKEFETVRELSEHFYFLHDDVQESQAIISGTSIDKRKHDWSCLHCSQRFKLLQSYIRHRYIVHKDESMVHICENCSKLLTSVSLVNVHVCLNVLSWACKPCNLTFPNGVELRLHNTACHLEKSGPHICTICGKRFLTMSMLFRHEKAKKCSPYDQMLEEKKVIQSRINNEQLNKKITPLKKEKTPEKKIIKEFARVQDLPNIRVIQEDVFIREAKNKTSGQRKKKLSSNSSKSQNNDEIYQCSMCKLYFLSKAGLKIHLSRAHTSAVEICQLCYKMFVTGNLVRHITDNHLKHDNNNQAHYKAMKVKQHNTFKINEQDIEKDTEELISTIGINQLLGLCEYQRFTEQSDDNDRFCPDCPQTFDNSEKYRRHYVQTHDKLCALCNMEFETGQDAARHKTRIHGSMACYVWFAHKLIAAISDTKTFSEIAEKIITDTISIEGNEIKMEIDNEDEYSYYVPKEEDMNGMSSNFDEWTNNNKWVEDYSPKEEIMYENSNTVVDVNQFESEINYAINDDDDYKLCILVTEDDLDKYKDNIAELARQIHSTCNIFSIDQIETMLKPYTEE